MPVCQVTLFGPLKTSCGKRTITRFSTSGTGLLLAYLACQPDYAAPIPDLMGHLWPDSREDNGRLLSATLDKLRRVLKKLNGADAECPVLTDLAAVRLNLPQIQTDRQQFEAFLQDAQNAADPESQIQHLQQAVALYQGPLLEDYEADWIAPERTRLAVQFENALRKLVDLLTASGRPEAAILPARRLLSLAPDDEARHRLLISLYIRSRRAGAALLQYQELVFSRYRSHSLPSEDTRQIIEELAARIAFPVQHNVLLAHAVRPADLFPARSVSPDCWPDVRKTLFGRTDEIKQIHALLDLSDTRLITLTGSPGRGKTHLALTAVQQITEGFGGTALFVPLAPLSDAREIPDAILSAAKLPRGSGGSALEQVIFLLGQEPSLLVLDNFEHLLDSGGRAFLWMLLNLIPSLKCLVTSRQAVLLAQEREIALRPLLYPQQDGSLNVLLEFPSVQLFVERAQSRLPHFRLTQENKAEVVRVCDRLQGIPLSITLAAAAIQPDGEAGMTFAPTVDYPAVDYAVQQANVPTPHSSLYDALEWSYRLLPPEIQQFFDRLSVFRNGWDADAAQGICDESNAAAFLEQLSDRSLLETDASGPTPRYFLLEVLREFAMQQMPPEAQQAQATRHLTYFLHLAEQHNANLRGENAAASLEWFQRDHDNLRAALRFCLQVNDMELGLRLVNSLWKFWLTRGRREEGRDWLQKFLQVGRSAAPVLLHPVYMGAGHLALHSGEPEEARDCYDRALAIRRTLPDKVGVASALTGLCLAAHDLHEHKLAITFGEQGLRILESANEPMMTAMIRSNMASPLTALGDYGAAAQIHAVSVALLRSKNNERDLSLALNNLASVLLLMDALSSVPQHLKEAVETAHRLDYADYVAHSLMNYAHLALKQRQVSRAVRLLGAFRRIVDASAGGFREAALREYDAHCLAAHETLDERTFDNLWYEGYTMHPQQVVAFAVSLQS